MERKAKNKAHKLRIRVFSEISE